MMRDLEDVSFRGASGFDAVLEVLECQLDLGFEALDFWSAVEVDGELPRNGNKLTVG